MTARGFTRRLAREDGIAMVLAVIVLVIVFIAAGTAIFVTSSSQQDAYTKKATQTAYTLAQGGLSNALAQLTRLYYDDNGQPTQLSPSLHDMAPWSGQVAGTRTSSTGGSMTWSARLDCPSPATDCPGGQSVAVSGFELGLWHVTATGSVQNPSGSATLTRTITVDVPLNQEPGPVNPPDILKMVYSGAPKTTDCDMNMNQQVDFKAPVYVVGNLCLKSGGSIESPTRLSVGGFLYNEGHGDIGTTAAALPEMHVVGSCTAKVQTPVCAPAWDSSKGYYSLSSQNIYATTFDNTITPITPPTVDWTKLRGMRGSWDCGNARDLTSTTTTFQLAGSSYTCTTDSGTLAWNSSTGVLTVTGFVYIDGNMAAQNADIKYTTTNGTGSIYVGGNVDLGTNTRICASDAGFSGLHDCNFGAWDATKNFVMLNAKGTFAASNLALEGGIYSDSPIAFGSGQSSVYGPIVTPQSITPGQQAASGFPLNFTVLQEEPGTSTPYWTLGDPQNGTY